MDGGGSGAYPGNARHEVGIHPEIPVHHTHTVTILPSGMVLRVGRKLEYPEEPHTDMRRTSVWNATYSLRIKPWCCEVCNAPCEIQHELHTHCTYVCKKWCITIKVNQIVRLWNLLLYLPKTFLISFPFFFFFLENRPCGEAESLNQVCCGWKTTNGERSGSAQLMLTLTQRWDQSE